MRGRTEGAAVAQWQCGCGMLLWCNWIFQVKTEWIIRLKIQTKICFQARSGPRLVPVSIRVSGSSQASRLRKEGVLNYIILYSTLCPGADTTEETRRWSTHVALHCGRGHTYILSRFVTGEAVVSLLLTSITRGETSLTRLEENTYYSL